MYVFMSTKAFITVVDKKLFMSETYRPLLTKETKKHLDEIKEELKIIEQKTVLSDDKDVDITNFKWRRENKTFNNDWIVRKALKELDIILTSEPPYYK